jgi:thiamine pyrophosphate-dependent acetolactate synthase large subunit-like protein
VVLSLDWLDLGGTLKQAWGQEAVGSRIIQVSVDHHIHNGWSMDHQSLPPADCFMACEPEPAVNAMLAALGANPSAQTWPETPPPATRVVDPDAPLQVADVAALVREDTQDSPVSLLRLPLSWAGDFWDFAHPLDFLGYDGGGGIGSGPGMVVGSALALQGSERLPLAIIGDGDFLMGVTAFWTAATARIPLLCLVANNRSFFNDELHQERVARERGRPVENRWIGQRIDDPAPDLAMMARAQGLTAFGPVHNATQMREVLPQALAAVRRGESVVVDVLVKPGYSPSMAQGMTRTQEG